MTPAVPASFVYLWASISAAFGGAALLLAGAGGAMLALLGLPFAASYAQSEVLKHHGRGVPRWTLYIGAGTILLSLLFTTLRVRSAPALARIPAGLLDHAAFDLLLALASTVLIGLGYAALIAWTVWGSRWPRSWILWFAGRVVVSLLSGTLGYGLGLTLDDEADATAAAGLEVLQGAADGAGTAWLLWRYVLPQPGPGRAGTPA